MVGQAPYDIPVMQSPAMQRGNDPTETASRVTPAAHIVITFAQIIVLRRTIASNTAPVIMRPIPLLTDSTPTRDTASDSDAFTEIARSFAKLITELPTAARKEMQTNAIQNDGLLSI